ncbi:MAG TPA: hypothetical protein VL021_10330 [Brumimicrobium sp.]|nr:hypothetical protein [Brumimicrobium sp.]
MNKTIISKYPSNIALVKYWGKYGNQLPKNASLSMTLSKAVTEVKLELMEKTNSEIELAYFFEGEEKEDFKERIVKYASAQPEFDYLLKNYALKINSTNSFPHSTGIASSASAFAAIAAALLSASAELDGDIFNREASRLSRLGSGSACRSFYGPYAVWGELDGLDASSNEFAVPVLEVHENFKNMRDAILIVEDQPKKVSSSVGHGLMKDHPYAEARFVDANKHCQEMLSTLKSGDFDKFISITEREALSLHAMMMTSTDYYMLMKPKTIQVIDEIFEFREQTGLPICFTLDAGPNVHLIYPESIEKEVKTFVETSLKKNTKSIIYDEIGFGGKTK